jgi:carbonic anhydrase
MSGLPILLVGILFSITSAQRTGVAPYVDYAKPGDWGGNCRTGKQQSPIDFQSNNANYTFLSKINAGILFNNYPPVVGAQLTILGNAKFKFIQPYMGSLYFLKNGLVYRYDLNEMHFHAPSEHSIGGKKLDLEMHLVHTKNMTEFFLTNPKLTADPDARNSRLAVGVVFSSVDPTGADVTVNNSFISNLRFSNPGVVVGNFTLNNFSTKENSFYHYEGSLTTPDCQEFVNWVFMTKFELATKSQIQDFYTLIFNNGGYLNNTRPTQDLNGRTIYSNNQQNLLTSLKSSGEFLKVSFISFILYLIFY